MNQEFEIKFKEAIDFLKNSDISSPNKPAIPHVLRVGYLLFKKKFRDEVVIAGILHDMLEWSSVKGEEIEKKFGKRVLELIKANSKDKSIVDHHERMADIVSRCKKIGDEAMAIKIADPLDSIAYYLLQKNEKELKSYREHAKLLIANLSENLKKVFLNDLEKVVE